ncbi:hypothetical protein ACXKZH_24790 [Priestia megaterium]
MTETDKEIEVIILSTYCDIVMRLLNNSTQLSVLKTIVLAYLLKKEEYQYKRLFNGNTTKNVTLKYLSTLNGEFDDFKLNLPYIVQSIDLLKKSQKVNVKNNEIKVLKISNTSPNLTFSVFVQNVIAESKDFSDEQFLKEVFASV